MTKSKELLLLILILLITAFFRFYNLMHDSPYFFNPDEKNMAISITRFRLPAKSSEIIPCVASELFPKNLYLKAYPDPDYCNLNPYFFAYGQFPLYLAYFSNQIVIKSIEKGSQLHNFLSSAFSLKEPAAHLPEHTGNLQLTTNIPSAIFYLRLISALSSTLSVLLIYLITKELLFSKRLFHSSRKKLTQNYKNGAPRLKLWYLENAQLGRTSRTRRPIHPRGNPWSSWYCDQHVIGSSTALISALLAAFTPAFIQSAHFGTTESLLIFFFLASIYFSIKLYKTPRNITFVKYLLCNTKYIILLSLTIGFALGSKLTALFFLAPPLIAFISQISKEIMTKKRIKRIGIIIISGLLFIIGASFFAILSSPFNLIEFEGFRSAVFGYEADVASGRYSAFYTRQFVNTIPILFQIKKIFPFALGWPIFLLGTAGFLLMNLRILIQIILSIISRIANYTRARRQALQITNLSGEIFILNFSFLVYFIPNTFLFAKWVRFMTPIFPFFIIFAGYFIYQIIYFLKINYQVAQSSKLLSGKRGKAQNYNQKLKTYQKLGCWIIGLLVIISIMPAVAFMSIYINEDSRVQASRWIYENIPSNTYILSETANVVDIPLGLPDNLNASEKKYQVISFDFYHLDEVPKLFNDILIHLEKSGYILIPSRRLFANYPRLSQQYPIISKYYELLFSGSLGFKKVAEISSYPSLEFGPLVGGLSFPDENSEETWTVFDHPVIRIYKKVKAFTRNDYRMMFDNR